MRAVLLSLEPWDEVWRRNQHLASRLVRDGHVEDLLFVAPATRSGAPVAEPEPGIRVVTPALPLPRRLGGLRLVARRLRPLLTGADVLWVNDPTLGVHLLRPGLAAVYDVTDDWRAFPQPARIRRRLVRAENRLARRARTVVCSPELARRWRARYGVDAEVVPNGIDADAWAGAAAVDLGGPRPHVGYVGTLHDERLDVDLLAGVAGLPEVGTVHLVGPDQLLPSTRGRLDALPAVRRHGPVAGADVPGVVAGLDVLVLPHLVTDFTLSLDAIKMYEYAASGRPVVATPTSGYQEPGAPGRATVAVDAPAFVAAVRAALTAPPAAAAPELAGLSWRARARAFAEQLERARAAATIAA